MKEQRLTQVGEGEPGHFPNASIRKRHWTVISLVVSIRYYGLVPFFASSNEIRCDTPWVAHGLLRSALNEDNPVDLLSFSCVNVVNVVNVIPARPGDTIQALQAIQLTFLHIHQPLLIYLVYHLKVLTP